MSDGYDIKKSGDTIDARTLQGSPYERSHASYLTEGSETDLSG